MAGRGTDIKLGEGVKELGGLAVIGTERHESRRIDNQLRGRSGRQGDPGYSRFFLSADDDLLKRFGGERFKNMISMITMQGGKGSETPLDFKMFSKMVLRAQRQIEGNNFDRRKTVLQYDEVLRKQREIIYSQRTDVLFLDSIEELITSMIDNSLTRTVSMHTQIDELYQALNGFFSANSIDKQILKTEANPLEYVLDTYRKDLENKKTLAGDKQFNDFLKAITLRVVDTYWVQHIDSMSELRQAVTLQSYGQINPFREYQELGFNMFETMIHNIQDDVTRYVLKAQVRQNTERVQVAKPVSTYSGKEDAEAKRKPRTVQQKVGRNDPCPCGSGKKYKYCHGRNDN
jgi:preprotein translocase subunit SecA